MKSNFAIMIRDFKIKRDGNLFYYIFNGKKSKMYISIQQVLDASHVDFTAEFNKRVKGI